jgi:hypothetical protein
MGDMYLREAVEVGSASRRGLDMSYTNKHQVKKTRRKI